MEAFIILVVIIITLSISYIQESIKKEKLDKKEEEEVTKNMSPIEKENYFKIKKAIEKNSHKSPLYGYTNINIICPFCQTKGLVSTRIITQKKGLVEVRQLVLF
ncbi:hypothetical protein BH10BAC5_BH10BAC5_28100 [soil metagenome]